MEVLEPDVNELTNSAREFQEFIAPLERRSRQALRGQGRSWCIRAFNENREGCERSRERALKKGGDQALGLYARMCRDGDHQIPPPAASTVCPVCEVGAAHGHAEWCELAPGSQNREAAA